MSKDSATYRREYKGEWVRDAGALVYPWSHNLNGIGIVEVPPKESLRYVLGIDIGYTEPSAFVVAAVAPSVSPHIYILESWKRENLDPIAVAEKTLKYIEKYGRSMRIVIDEGGIGKGYAPLMRERFNIGCEPAEKNQKRAFQEIVAGELAHGTVKIVDSECADLIDEMKTLQWGPNHEKEDERFENHCCDALLYSVRASRTWLSFPGFPRHPARRVSSGHGHGSEDQIEA